MRKITAIIIALILLSAMTVSSFAAIAVSVDVKMDTQDNSYTLIANAATETAENQKLNYKWYECNADGSNSVEINAAGNVLQPYAGDKDKYYYCTVSKTSENGESLDYGASDVIKIQKNSNQENGAQIFTFSVTGIDEPVVGEKPDTTAEIAGDAATAGYTVSSVTWSPSDATFKADKPYKVTVRVKLNEGASVGTGAVFLINGYSSVLEGGDSSTGEITFSYTYKSAAATPEEETDQEPVKVVDKVTEVAEALPAPLGIPGWIWAGIIIIAIIALIVAIVSRSAAKKRKKESKENIIGDIYEDKIGKYNIPEHAKRVKSVKEDDDIQENSGDTGEDDSGIESDMQKEDAPSGGSETDGVPDNNISYYEDDKRSSFDMEFTSSGGGNPEKENDSRMADSEAETFGDSNAELGSSDSEKMPQNDYNSKKRKLK